jgi:hypothetical protein
MPVIRIPQADWERVWDFLVKTGPISRVSQEPVYHVSEEQVRLLRKRKLPFAIISANGPAEKRHHG